jgi:hypothetical protein
VCSSDLALVGLGIPTGLVIASVHEKRDLFREELREAARSAAETAGAQETSEGRRGLRPSDVKRLLRSALRRVFVPT